MKILLVFTALVFVGCRTITPGAPLPLPAKSVPEPRPIAAAPAPAATPPPSAALGQKIRQQAQLIEALISQNDALTAKLAAIPTAAEPRAIMVSNTPTPSSQPAPVPPSGPIITPAPAAELLLLPNADGVIDLAAVSATAPPGEPTNPFVMRTVPPEAMREISLRVGGIIAGPVPCAIINERLVQSGETIESFAVERIESEAVFFRYGEHRLRLPVAEKPARVRLAL